MASSPQASPRCWPTPSATCACSARATLLTCTPYGINTQRLLVRGHQVDASQTRNIYIGNEAYRIEPLIVMPMVALPMIFVFLLYVLFAPVKKETLGEDI